MNNRHNNSNSGVIVRRIGSPFRVIRHWYNSDIHVLTTRKQYITIDNISILRCRTSTFSYNPNYSPKFHYLSLPVFSLPRLSFFFSSVPSFSAAVAYDAAAHLIVIG